MINGLDELRMLIALLIGHCNTYYHSAQETKIFPGFLGLARTTGQIVR